MRTKVTLVLIFLNVALFYFIFKFERNWRTEAASLEARRRVLGSEAASIRLLEVTSPVPAGSFALVRNRDTWFLTKPLDWPANPYAVNSIVQALQLLEHETSFGVADLAKAGRSLADYGLDQPKFTVAFSSGDPTAGPAPAPPVTTLRIGDMTPDGKRLYVLSPDGARVHVVGRALVDSLSVPPEQLRTDALITIQSFEARSLVVRTNSEQNRSGAATGLRTRIRRDPAAPRWSFETPNNARASKTAVELTINDLNGLHARSFAPPPPATLPSVAQTLYLTLEGNNRHETLFLGEPVPAGGTGNPGSTATTEYYAQLEGRSPLFTVVVPNRLVEALRTAQESLREKHILVDLDPHAVTAIAIAAPLQSVTLQRLDATAGAGPEAAPRWQIIQRSDGAQGPQPLAADRNTVQRFLEQLALLTAEKFKSDAPTAADLEDWGFNRPERKITLTFAGSTPPLILQIGTDAGTPRNVYARIGSPTDAGLPYIYTINVDIGQQFPTEVNEWRDRSLREPLPAGARFTALKITDLGSNRVVFETTFNAAGEPVGPPADAAQAVQQVMAQVRSLRAQRILPTAFAEKVPLPGDERPWRFQLEATAILPGAGEPGSTTTLLLTERIGGAQQYAGSKELDMIFELEQPFLDALWTLMPRELVPPAAAPSKG